ncbi:hypothetical protein ACFYNO_15055 [Kitasatospora sp. NPDC006697]|uniref:hypothetical protein n=1 Tax=unclassified Kitasatospora TaxID=2633591 RepID=UPI0036831782
MISLQTTAEPPAAPSRGPSARRRLVQAAVDLVTALTWASAPGESPFDPVTLLCVHTAAAGTVLLPPGAVERILITRAAPYGGAAGWTRE